MSYIIGCGIALPERIVTNAELAPQLGVSPEWIETNSGIRERRWVTPEQSTSDLATQAVSNALVAAELTAEQIEFLIAGTLSPDYQVPGIAPLIQRKLSGCRQIPAVDLRVGCAQILYSLQIARGLISSKVARLVACCGAEVQSKGLDVSPRSAEISMLFGDAAGALILSDRPHTGSPEHTNALEIEDILIATDGNYAEDLGVKAPGTANGAKWLDTEIHLAELLHQPMMNGRNVILHAVRKMGDAAAQILARNDLSIDQIDLLVPHQANLNLLRQLAKRLPFPEEKVMINLDRFGNTSGASAFLALWQAIEEKRLIPGMRVLILAFSTGFTWGSALCRVVMPN